MANYGSFAKAVTVAGTSEQIFTNQVYDWWIIADPANTGNIFIGGSNVNSANGFILEPGAAVGHGDLMIRGQDENTVVGDLYIDADVTGESVRVLWFRRDV